MLIPYKIPFKIVKRGRSRLKNLFSALAIAAITAAAAAAAILRTLTFEASPFLLDPFIKRLLILTTVKALKCIKCINTLVKLNSLIAANRSPMTRSASSISLFPLALALAAFIAPVAFAALVALIIVALFALVVALAAFAAAPAVAMTLAKRRAKVKRLLKALIDLLL
ncbi:hypothetical protein MBM_09757 [Drepanopeziza brunnea f. sp. 'multigermtubi' MB_m1]|uniref:Uncharacterized protein n=1 Tax=Marssonina brunnea f. sp. multigermtubi (strain MB_m1) TaxID=1072389 RepID=K1WU26_MARBU|nr:uncharacterized protein MBM_09757 [Drepanopeziza brunnea f. sp. 'multigermtubi' MB_m1]EKD12078.1 hypothetical protein MBM_09757 [Drepanopeziza brunnea f. sp. 'multigermtubi' MB_m1]